jgi:hypothetical protein
LARLSKAFLLLAGLGPVAGCSLPHDVGLAERCADLMRRADPAATMEITKSGASATSLTTVVAQVEGVRTGLPAASPAPRTLAVECRFDENVLTDFRWTAGPKAEPGR